MAFLYPYRKGTFYLQGLGSVLLTRFFHSHILDASLQVTCCVLLLYFVGSYIYSYRKGNCYLQDDGSDLLTPAVYYVLLIVFCSSLLFKNSAPYSVCMCVVDKGVSVPTALPALFVHYIGSFSTLFSCPLSILCPPLFSLCLCPCICLSLSVSFISFSSISHLSLSLSLSLSQTHAHLLPLHSTTTLNLSISQLPHQLTASLLSYWPTIAYKCSSKSFRVSLRPPA